MHTLTKTVVIQFQGKGLQETFWLVDRKRKQDPWIQDFDDNIAPTGKMIHVSSPPKPLAPATHQASEQLEEDFKE